MATDLFEWRNKDKTLSIGVIFLHPRNGVLLMACPTREAAMSVQTMLQEFDPKCFCMDRDVAISKGKDPLKLADYLFSKGLVDQGCYDEMKKELEEYQRDRGDNEPPLPGH